MYYNILPNSTIAKPLTKASLWTASSCKEHKPNLKCIYVTNMKMAINFHTDKIYLFILLFFFVLDSVDLDGGVGFPLPPIINQSVD